MLSPCGVSRACPSDREGLRPHVQRMACHSGAAAQRAWHAAPARRGTRRQAPDPGLQGQDGGPPRPGGTDASGQSAPRSRRAQGKARPGASLGGEPVSGSLARAPAQARLWGDGVTQQRKQMAQGAGIRSGHLRACPEKSPRGFRQDHPVCLSSGWQICIRARLNHVTRAAPSGSVASKPACCAPGLCLRRQVSCRLGVTAAYTSQGTRPQLSTNPGTTPTRHCAWSPVVTSSRDPPLPHLLHPPAHFPQMG